MTRDESAKIIRDADKDEIKDRIFYASTKEQGISLNWYETILIAEMLGIAKQVEGGDG